MNQRNWVLDQDAGNEWDWVDAAPFRAHLRHVMEATGMPWRVLALYAQVPCPVVRSLLHGRNGRPVRRIAPAYAQALFDVTAAKLRLSRLHRVSSTHTAALSRALVATGLEVRQVAGMLGLTCEQTRILLDGGLASVGILTELAARAACLAQALPDPNGAMCDSGSFAVGTRSLSNEPLAA